MKETVIVAGARTPVGAFGKSLRDVPAAELGVQVLEGLMAKTPLTKDEVNEIVFGHGYVHGGGLNSARIASQRAGFTRDVPAHIVIKACGSGLKAITTAALTVAAGQEEVVIAGGRVKSMSVAGRKFERRIAAERGWRTRAPERRRKRGGWTTENNNGG